MKTLLLWAACCLCLWRTATAQASWQWAKAAPNFTVNDAVTDAAGEALVTGSFSVPVSFSSPYFTGTLTPVGLSDIILVRYDANGNVKWARQVGGSGATAEGISLALDGAGNGYLAGSYADAALTVNTGGVPVAYVGGSLGTGRTCVLKFAAATGTVSWGRGAGGGTTNSRSCTPAGVAVTSAGTCFLTGTYGSYAQFGSLSIGTTLKQAAFVAAYSGSGSVLWAQSTQPTGGAFYQTQSRGGGVATDASGNCYVTGSYAYSGLQLGTLQLGAANASLSFVARLNPTTGAAVWLRGTTANNTTDVASGHSVAVVGNSCYVTGGFSGTIAFGGTYTLLAPTARGYVASYTAASGSTSWVRPLLDALGTVRVAASGTSVVAAGAIAASGTLGAQSKLWFYEPSGVSQGSLGVVSGSPEASSKISGLGYAGSVLHVGGPINGFCIFGGNTVSAPPTGPAGYFVARLNTAAARGAAASPAAMATIYPNPATDALRILLPGTAHSAALYNQQGHLVRQLKVSQAAAILVQGLRPGRYWLRWQGADGAGSQQLLVQP
ncbi:SBBP repeat-containing protein [Hymenobacter metallilatus]|uniref:T9SS C-terminal target domain-containing protein n=1 Tax=Hymenobacter metallilatus TaxID=2493666 RepID=A0A428JQZ2_9BACT|nr:SBBP repeat-containing protein [Hymenobacter metallilatus]RSK35999.1 T9SS C-terminal target domain-containing protein [Hymenobacter metallilatus]